MINATSKMSGHQRAFWIPVGFQRILVACAVVGALGIAVAVAAKSKHSAKRQNDLIGEAFNLDNFELTAVELPEESTLRKPFTTWIDLNGKSVQIALNPYSLRSRGFRVWSAGEQGLMPYDSPPPQTWRGRIIGSPESAVAASVDGGLLYAHIDDGHDTYWLEPVRNAIAGVDPTLHVVYKSQDTRPGMWTCGTDDNDYLAAESGGVATTSLSGCIQVTEIAFDADFEFFIANGSDENATVADIERVMNEVDAIFRRDCNITYEISAIVVRTEEPDGYESSNPSVLFSEFSQKWNTDPDLNPKTIPRDVAHLMTGKDLNGGVLGIASLGTVCTTDEAYGLSQSRFTEVMGSRVAVTTHELGHNWGAKHCDGDSSLDPNLDCKIMCSSFSNSAGRCDDSRFEFGQGTIDTITTFRSSVECLEQSTEVSYPLEILLPEELATDDHFGVSVAIDGNIAIIGAYLDDDDKDKKIQSIGSAYIYRIDPATQHWKQEAKLTASDSMEFDSFGISVDIVQGDGVNEDVAVVGSFLADAGESNSGTAYVFRKSKSGWQEEEKLTNVLPANSLDPSDFFGQSITVERFLDSEIVLVGAYLDDGVDDTTDGSGAVYVFTNESGNWALDETLRASDAAQGDQFGVTVSVAISPTSGNPTALVGAWLDDQPDLDSGSAYIFERDGSNWSEVINLTPTDSAAGDNFGISVSLSTAMGTKAEGVVGLIGSLHADSSPATPDTGAAYVFREAKKGWEEEMKLFANDGESNDEFGIDVSISRDLALVGAHLDSGLTSQSGSAYAFRRTNETWALEDKLVPAGLQSLDRFGLSVDVNDGKVIVGTWSDDDAASGAGSAFVSSGEPVAGDCNGNGVPDGCDIDSGDNRDCNNNGIPEACEFADGVIDDCNSNKVFDTCDIIDGTSMDENGNWIPDECENLCLGDVDDDGDADVNDLRTVILNWGNPGGPGDADGNGQVDVNDLRAVILDWGTCPQQLFVLQANVN